MRAAVEVETPRPLKARLADALDCIRARTLQLVEPLSEESLNAVHDPLMSPIAWDLGHIANFEELWLVQRAGGRPPLRDELGPVYDAFTAPRRSRGGLPFLRSAQCIEYMRVIRERTLACLEDADLSEEGGRLLADGFVYELIARHEQQHSETILQTLQIMTSEDYAPLRSVTLPAGRETDEEMLLVEGGRFEMGAPSAWFSYDNERPLHECGLRPFWIDKRPVTNGEMRAFIDDGGYGRQEWWSREGWRWKEREGIDMPRYWQRHGDDLAVRWFDSLQPLDPGKPVCCVSWFEADAYARYAGKRLPSEAEWEHAASWVPGEAKRRYPWGDGHRSGSMANLDQLAFDTAPVGAYPEGASPCGAEQMVGDVWEWTASRFGAYPGFEAFPYPEYSEPFFDGPFRVLRGGSWATQPRAVTTTFRNWDYPDRRQIFAGFRCARDGDSNGVADKTDERGA